MALTLVTAATDYPITVTEAKAQCRVDGTDDDDYIETLIAAATAHVEDMTGRALVEQTWKLTLDTFSDAMALTKGPVSSVVSVKYFDTDGVEQTVSTDDYTVDLASDPQWVVRNSDASWPTILAGVNAVNITFVCGYDPIPPAIIHAIKLLIVDWYDGRADTVSERGVTPTSIPNGVTALLANHRSYAF